MFLLCAGDPSLWGNPEAQSGDFIWSFWWRAELGPFRNQGDCFFLVALFKNLGNEILLVFSLQFKFRIVSRRLITVTGILVHQFRPRVKKGQGKTNVNLEIPVLGWVLITLAFCSDNSLVCFYCFVTNMIILLETVWSSSCSGESWGSVVS